ncbi:MAG: hypothetical protein HY691_14695 [Chloroflexi bacterium]|nr:hypothetical protein [Chloroflexota bacterium]
MTEPTREQWQALYAAASEFDDLAPWVWMTDDDLFAVQDSETGEVAYCVVMGSGSQEFGLAAFLGPQGFASFRQLMLGELEPESLDAAALLRSVSLSFQDRAVLARQDREVIRSLGLRFRGRNAWPWFRSQRPGYVPWFLDGDEARILTLALRQAVQVSQRVEAGDLTLTLGVDDQPILTRCLREGRWVDEWRPPPARPPSREEPEPLDEVRLRRLREAKPRSREGWELDLFTVAAAVGGRGERPYLPVMLLAATQQGFVLGTTLLQPWTSATERQEAVLDLLEKGPHLPREIRVGREEVRRLLGPLTRALGIGIRVANLAVLEALKADLIEHLG